ncbi:hypothetical protein EDB83DRAFT_2328731 [Lactarius deliciosus]|nr:hypothetical protein EDB83DRAFT_2328731 [Lactarius deliciosus]
MWHHDQASLGSESGLHLTHCNVARTYFDTERQSTDPVVALNILWLFYSRGRGHELTRTLEWVLGVLKHRAYFEGMRYETAECFLFFALQLLRASTDARLHKQLPPFLRKRILERGGAAGDALTLSMRVLVGIAVGVRLERELAELLPFKYDDSGGSKLGI